MSIKFLLKKQTFFIGFLFVLVNTISVQAAVVYTNYSIPYTVTVPTNQAPVVDAGPDKAITLPSTSTSATGTASDPDGTLSTTIWTFASGPVAATIGTQNNTSPSTVTFSGMTVAGVYVFRFNAEDNLGLWGWDEMQVVVSSAATPSGTLSANNCTISSGGSSCGSTVEWMTTNLTANPTTITRNTGTPSSFTPSPLATGTQAVTLWYGMTTFSLLHNGSLLAQANGTASCASGTSWDGDSCEGGGGGPINGMCDASHWNCIQGTPSGQTGSGTGPWTWSCVGSNGGSTDSCYEAGGGGGGGGGGKPECSDGVDNDSDGFTDYPDDPGCSSDADTSEVDRRKPIFIEF